MYVSIKIALIIFANKFILLLKMKIFILIVLSLLVQSSTRVSLAIIIFYVDS